MSTPDLQTVRAPRVLRAVAALILLEHGTQKLLGFPPRPDPPAVRSLSWTAGLLELVGGALILGWWARPVAFVRSGEMALACWIAHTPRSFFPVLNGGDAAILYRFRAPLPRSLDAGRAGFGNGRSRQAGSPGNRTYRVNRPIR